MGKFIKNLSGGMRFFLGMGLLYAVLFAVFPLFTRNAFYAAAKDFWDILPMLAFFFFMIFVINTVLNPETVKRHLGKDSGWR